MKQELICINCPMGCNMEVEYDEKNIISVKGNNCKNGVKYAEKEVFNPERIVTTTVSISGAAVPLLPVKTLGGIPKDLCRKAVEAASVIQVSAPVRVGDIIMKNILKTGINLVAARSLDKI